MNEAAEVRGKTYYVFRIVLLGSDSDELDIYANSDEEAWAAARKEAASLYDHYELHLIRKI